MDSGLYSLSRYSHKLGGGGKTLVVERYLVTLWIIFSWLLLALQIKVVKVASFVGKIFMV